MTLYHTTITVEAMQIPDMRTSMSSEEWDKEVSKIAEWLGGCVHINPQVTNGVLISSHGATMNTFGGYWIVKEGRKDWKSVGPSYFAEKYELVTYGGEQGEEVSHLE